MIMYMDKNMVFRTVFDKIDTMKHYCTSEKADFQKQGR